MALRFDVLELLSIVMTTGRWSACRSSFPTRMQLSREDVFAAFHGIVLAEALGGPFRSSRSSVPVSLCPRSCWSRTGIPRLVEGGTSRPRSAAEQVDPLRPVDDPELSLLFLRISIAAMPRSIGTTDLLRGMSEKEVLAVVETWDGPVTSSPALFDQHRLGAKASEGRVGLSRLWQSEDKKVSVVRAQDPPKRPCSLDVEGMPDRFLVGVVVDGMVNAPARFVLADDDRQAQRSGSSCSISCVCWASCTLFHSGLTRRLTSRMLRMPFPDTVPGRVGLGFVRSWERNIIINLYSNEANTCFV